MKKRSIKIIVAVVVLVLIYAAGALYYSNSMIPNVKMYDEKIKPFNVSSIKKSLAGKDVVLIVKDKRKELKLPIDSLDYKVEDIKAIEKNIIKDQNPFMWPISAVIGHNHDAAKIEVNKKQLDKWVEKNDVINNKGLAESKDAYFKIDEATGEVSVVDEIVGERLDEVLVVEEMTKSLNSGSLEVDLNKAIIMPNAMGKDLRKTVDEVQYKINNDISITIDGKDKKIEPTKNEKLKWLNIDYTKNNVSVEKKAITNYLKSVNKSFKKSAGSTDTVYSVNEGVSTLISEGKSVSGVDEYALTAKIYDAMQNNYALNDNVKAVSISQPKASYQGHKSIDNNFIEVSIAKQKVYLYTDGKLVLTADVVTGKPGGDTDTNKGSFTVMYKATDFTLKGDAYGYDYKLPVSYWIPFEGGGGIGLHDAPWRSHGDFGGKLYLSTGSHGCINMRIEDVRKIFNTIVAGTGVWVH